MTIIRARVNQPEVLPNYPRYRVENRTVIVWAFGFGSSSIRYFELKFEFAVFFVVVDYELRTMF